MKKYLIYSALLAILFFTQCSKTDKYKSKDKVLEKNEALINTDSIVHYADSLKLIFNYDGAFISYTKAIKIFSSQNDYNRLFLAYVKTAEMFRAKSQFNEADKYLQKAKTTLPLFDADKANLMLYYNRKAALSAEYYKQPDTTLYYTTKALDVAKELNDSSIIFSSTMELGVYWENSGNYKVALETYNDAIKIANQIKSVQMHNDALINACRIYSKIGDIDKLYDEASKGYKLSKNNNMLFHNLMFAQYLSEAEYKRGNYEQANKYLWERLNLTDVYFEKRYDDKIIETETKYKIVEKEKEVAVKELELTEKENDIYKQQIVIAFIGLLLFFSLLLFAIIFYYYRKTKNQNQQLNFLNEQNKFLISETNHRVNNNLQLISVFINQELMKNENDGVLQKLNSYIDSMAILHRHLYKRENKKIVKINEYLFEVISNLEPLMQEKAVALNYKIDAITIDNNKAMYLGLLINELFINSLKHGFLTNANNNININILAKDKDIQIEYEDNGIGIGNNSIPKIISQICKQLNANYRIKSDKGFYFYTLIEP